jgi:hypothetical protein
MDVKKRRAKKMQSVARIVFGVVAAIVRIAVLLN